jgi:benzoylformate decarboxylase
MGSIFSAYQNETPLIIAAGQQTREMLLLEPWLTNIDPDLLPRPWVKWSYQPARPENIPAAFMRAYATAVQPPSGPVFLSLPLDDWDKPMDDVDVYRTVATRVGPEPERVRQFAERINVSRNPVLVYGADLARSQAWEAGVRLAEQLNAPVWTAPYSEQAPFPQTHPLFQGVLPDAIGPLSDKLSGHDLAIVVGAQVFRYYPYVPGPYLPSGTSLLHVTDDPDMSAKAPVGDSLVADSLLFLEQIAPLVQTRGGSPPVVDKPRAAEPDLESLPLSPDAVFSVIRPLCPDEFVMVEETGSNDLELHQRFPIEAPDTFYAVASGCLGWGMPGAVGHALAEQTSGRHRPVIAIIGDGSFQYSPQSIYTAVQ